MSQVNTDPVLSMGGEELEIQSTSDGDSMVQGTNENSDSDTLPEHGDFREIYWFC